MVVMSELILNYCNRVLLILTNHVDCIEDLNLILNPVIKFSDFVNAGEIGWREREHNGEEWKKLLRTAGNHRILHMPMNE